MTGRGHLATSILFILPLFLAYEAGVLFSSQINGVDFLSRYIYSAVNGDRSRYLMIHLAIATGFFLFVWLYQRKQPALVKHSFVPMVLESAIYALTLGTFIVFVMQKLLGFSLAIQTPLFLIGELGPSLVVALGAGVHEELVFRLILFSGGAWLLKTMGIQHKGAMLLSLVVSSVLFSMAHHLGPLGDVFQLDVFTYRLLAGFAFAAIYYYRSLSHAVYSHFLYDVYVLLLRQE